MIYCFSCKKRTPDNDVKPKIIKIKDLIFNQIVQYVKN